jgi:hypothetical protein
LNVSVTCATARKVVLVLLSVSVALGSSLRSLLPAFGEGAYLAAFDDLAVEIPVEEYLFPQESTTGSRSSSPASEGEEVEPWSLERTLKRRGNEPSRYGRGEQLYIHYSVQVNRIIFIRHEHRLRNGFGAPLRC